MASFLTKHMETMLSLATDPVEIELRRKVLDDHLAAESLAEQRKQEEADFSLLQFSSDKDLVA